MNNKITIGKEVYTRTASNGWVHEETQIPANKALQTMLELIENGQLSGKDMPKDPQVTDTDALKNLPDAKFDKSDKPVEDKDTVEEKTIDASEAKSTDKEEYDVVTLYDTKYVYDEQRGWIDSKTKKQAPKELLALIEGVTNKKNDPKVKLEKSFEIEPVTIAGTKYTYDIKKGYWVNGKIKASDDVQKFLARFVTEAALDNIKNPPTTLLTKKDDDDSTDDAENVTKPKTRRDSNLNKNTLISLADKLGSINSTIIDAMMNNYKYDSLQSSAAREAVIESKSSGTRVYTGSGTEADKSSFMATVMVLGVGALIAANIDTVAETIGTLISTVETAFESFMRLKGMYDDIREGKLWNVREETQEDRDAVDATNANRPIGGFSLFNIRRESEDTNQLAPPTQPGIAPNAQSEATETTGQAPQSAPAGRAPTTTRSGSRPTSRRTGNPATGIPRNDINGLQRWLRSQGLVTKADRGRADRGSSHASGQALDVNAPGGIVEANSPEWGPRFDGLASQLTEAGYNVMWRVRGHQNHIHVQTGSRGSNSRSFWRGGGSPNADVTGSSGVAEQNPISEVGDDLIGGMVDLLSAVGINTDLGGTFIPNVTSPTNNIADLAVQKYADMVDRTIEEESADQQIAQLPNLNARRGGTVQTPSSSSDRNVINDYLVYFGYDPLNRQLQSF